MLCNKMIFFKLVFPTAVGEHKLRLEKKEIHPFMHKVHITGEIQEQCYICWLQKERKPDIMDLGNQLFQTTLMNKVSFQSRFDGINEYMGLY